MVRDRRRSLTVRQEFHLTNRPFLFDHSVEGEHFSVGLWDLVNRKGIFLPPPLPIKESEQEKSSIPAKTKTSLHMNSAHLHLEISYYFTFGRPREQPVS